MIILIFKFLFLFFIFLKKKNKILLKISFRPIKNQYELLLTGNCFLRQYRFKRENLNINLFKTIHNQQIESKQINEHHWINENHFVLWIDQFNSLFIINIHGFIIQQLNLY